MYSVVAYPPPIVIARHILLWARRCQAFEKNILGPTSKASLIALEQGQPLEEIAANGVTNGAAMRVAPMGPDTDGVHRRR